MLTVFILIVVIIVLRFVLYLLMLNPIAESEFDHVNDYSDLNIIFSSLEDGYFEDNSFSFYTMTSEWSIDVCILDGCFMLEHTVVDDDEESIAFCSEFYAAASSLGISVTETDFKNGVKVYRVPLHRDSVESAELAYKFANEVEPHSKDTEILIS